MNTNAYLNILIKVLRSKENGQQIISLIWDNNLTYISEKQKNFILRKKFKESSGLQDLNIKIR